MSDFFSFVLLCFCAKSHLAKLYSLFEHTFSLPKCEDVKMKEVLHKNKNYHDILNNSNNPDFNDEFEQAMANESFKYCRHLAIEIGPDASDWSKMGTSYCHKGELGKALVCFDEAIKRDSGDILSIVSKAGIYSELNDFKKADEYFEMARRIDDNDVGYLVEMGKHLLNQDEFQKSIIYFDRCLESDNEMALAWMYKSMALSEIGRDMESEKCFNIAIHLDPHSLNVFDDVLVIED